MLSEKLTSGRYYKMSTWYQIKMRDEFNWEYVGTSKENQLKKFCDEIEHLGGARPDLLFEWYGHAIFELYKTNPRIKKYGELILKHCDTAHYWGDCEDPELRKLKKEDLM